STCPLSLPTPRPPRATLFPYTTLFRSADRPQGGAGPDQGPVARRRRLPPEAVLAAGACAAGERGAAPPRGPGGGGRRRHDRRPARARQDRASRDGRRHRGRAHRDRVQAVAHADRAGRARAEPGATVGNGVARAARHSDAHRRHARPAATAEAREGGRVHRDRARRRLPLPPPRGPRHGRSGEPQARVKLVTRLFLTTSLLLAVAVGGLIVAADRLLRRYLEEEIAQGLEREARLVAMLLPADSLTWPEAARALGQRIGHRITLIDPTGKVRGDTEFDRASLAQLENHFTRPEVRAAIGRDGVGRDERLSASTNERRLYVAARGGPPGLAVVRVSTTLAVVDGQVGRVQGAGALAGFTALLAPALFAWLLSRDVARPLVPLAGAAQAIAAGQPPSFPQSRAPEVAQHILALRAMHEELDQRFTELRRERDGTATPLET